MADAQFVIETGIELPPITRAHGGGRASKYPFDAMKPGDSFLVNFNGDEQKQVTRRVRTATLIYRRKNSTAKFKTRLMDGGLRVFCTEK